MEITEPWQVDDVRERVGKRLNEFLAVQRPPLASISSDAAGLADTVSEFVSGGKRLRAVFLYWGWRAAGGADCEPIITAAASMEMLQACALIHDDVMDRSDVRRGAPAVHRQYQTQHQQGLWSGSANDFGTGAAILVGDLCLTWADMLLLQADLPAEALARGKAVYDELRTELMAGQYLDILEQARRTPTTESAMRVITYKSAKYTIERPLQLGAALADGQPEVMQSLRDYGLALGQAFQLRDDLLGVFGDPATTGKPAGDDLLQGKRTVLVAHALEQATPEQQQEFLAAFGDPAADATAVTAMTDFIIATGAQEQVEQQIAALTEQARTAAASPLLDSTSAAVLDSLITAATKRKY